MVTRPLPLEARRVARLIQKFVPRPTLEELVPNSGALIRFNKSDKRRYYCCCPLGMMPEAMSATPASISTVFDNRNLEQFRRKDGSVRWRHKDYPLIDGFAIVAFTTWWDEQTDPVAAIEAVWGCPEEEEVHDPSR